MPAETDAANSDALWFMDATNRTPRKVKGGFRWDAPRAFRGQQNANRHWVPDYLKECVGTYQTRDDAVTALQKALAKCAATLGVRRCVRLLKSDTRGAVQ